MPDPMAHGQQTVVFAYPGDLDTPTGGYGYDRRIIGGLKELGWTVELLPLGDGFPFPDERTLTLAQSLLEGLADQALVVVDGLAFGVMADAAASVSGRVRLLALVHHPLCLETGNSAAVADQLRQAELDALRHAHHVIVTSPSTAMQVRDMFGLSADRLSVVLPGTDVAQPTAPKTNEPLRLLAVGTIVRRKGYDLLFEALSGLKTQAWHLDVVGDTTRDQKCFQDLTMQLERLGLTEKVTFHGAVPETQLDSFYGSADLFVLASRYEGFGMAYTEALAHGLPVIGSGDGAVAETLSVGGALYCPTEDVDALRDALSRVLHDRQLREQMARDALSAACSLQSWDAAAEKFSRVLEQVE